MEERKEIKRRDTEGENKNKQAGNESERNRKEWKKKKERI
jgi:hypothetical protein